MQQPYVPPPAIGGKQGSDLRTEALVGCMRWLGNIK
jgi:hypothetical protein